ncbi:MAG: CpsD/CapB family tyrosine-protein kinase [Actinomycetota bacterium]|nr:CpsD/CapB family tyrosine-protein kinase [Actinomycetota bacterium]
MANIYEALQRAEKERDRKVSGEEVGVPVQPRWEDEAPKPAAPKPSGFLGGFFGRRAAQRAEADAAGDINKRRISMLQPDSYVAEQYRTLRGRIDSIATQRPIHTIAIVSANQGEGKSTCAINLAAVTSLSVDRSVLLMDCDLRRPRIHASLGLEPKVGLGEVLTGQATLDDALIPVEGLGLHVLGVRNIPGNPSELLGSVEMKNLVAQVGERYDRVILDTPASLGLPDSKTVAELCDGVVMVVRADVTSRNDVQGVLELIDRRRVVGMVINGTSLSRRLYGYY